MSHTLKNSRTCSRGHPFAGADPCPVCYPGFRTFRMRGKVWLYPGTEANWHFVNLPKKQSEVIRNRFGAFKRGWGSLPVTATIGKTAWKTSIFPDKKSGTYLLPLKADTRKREKLDAGKNIAFTVEIRE
jgi:Domain of unknown function (DUF1905)